MLHETRKNLACPALRLCPATCVSGSGVAGPLPESVNISPFTEPFPLEEARAPLRRGRRSS